MYKIITLIFVIVFSILQNNFASAGELVIVNEGEFIKRIKEDNHKHKILFFFASWCSYCKKAINEIVIADDKMKENSVYLISLDKEYANIFLMAKKMPENAKIYYMQDIKNIVNIFHKFNIKYSNKVPHITILNHSNENIKDDINVRQLKKYLE